MSINCQLLSLYSLTETSSDFGEDNYVTFKSSYMLEVVVAELDQTDGTGGPTSRVELMSTGDLCSRCATEVHNSIQHNLKYKM